MNTLIIQCSYSMVLKKQTDCLGLMSPITIAEENRV